jgi:beta-glucosidase
MKKILILPILALLLFTLSACQEDPPVDTTIDCDTYPSHKDCQEVIDLCDGEEGCIEEVIELLNGMTLEQKAAQMVQAERSSITPYQVEQYGIGSILSGGGSHPSAYDDTVEDWYNMYKNYQEAALDSDSGIPLIYGIDAVHGNNNLYGATIFPHNIGLGAANDPDLIYDISRATAEEMLITGINWNFAPALSVVQNIRWGRTYEGFSENPEIHDNLTVNAILGMEEHGVSATAKHYLGDGGTIDGIDQGNTIGDTEDIRELHLAPYYKAIEAGVDTIMISYSSVNGIKVHGSSYWINDILKGELGFEGFIISDWNAIHQLSGNFKQQIITSINAGVDMLMEPYDWEVAIGLIVEAVEDNLITEERIDDAVTRILTVKWNRGLFEDPLYRLEGDYLYNADHQAIAREAVQKSLVLLKNDGNSLPLDKDETIFITGPASDHVGLMSGGWTTYWQGNGNADIGVGTSILDAFTDVLTSNGGSIVNNYNDASTVVVVLSEISYSEGAGDNDVLTLTGGTAHEGNLAALQLAEDAQAAGKNVVGILISGRPLLLEDYLDDFDSFVAAWLPGSEGGNGISDVLFGDVDFTGTLSFTWPATFAQVGITSNDEDYDEMSVLYPYGYGLTYNE